MFSIDTLWAIAGFIVILAPIVLIHELGHFLAARWSNIHVEEFGLGLPPRAMTLFKRNGTIYSLNWIPLGGFVRPAGEDDPNIPGGLAGASKRARFFVLSAGAGANFISAFFIIWIALMIGRPAVAIGTVTPGAPADQAGLLAGDVILAVNGERAENTADISAPMYELGGQPVELLIRRDGQEQTLTVTPRTSEQYDPEVEGPVGVTLTFSSEGDRISMGPIDAAVDGLGFVANNFILYARLPSMLMNGDISPEEARPVSPVGISQIAGQTAALSVENSTLFPILQLAAFISIALGLTNLLPIPALDGGRILFVLIEAVRGRRIEPEREGMVHVIGMMFLLGLMVLLVIQDIVNPILF